MPTQKIDPKVIFASDAPAIDKPPVFSDKTKGWDVARLNDGRPEIKQMNKMQQDTDLKILWLNENSVTPYDASIDYPDGAVVIKDGSFKQLLGGLWVEFLDDFADKDAVKRGIANRYDSSLTYNSGERVVLTNGDIVKSTIDGNTNDPNVDMTGWRFDDNTVESVADLLAIQNPKNGSRVYVKSYYTATNYALLQPFNGGGWFFYSDAKRSINNNITIFNGWVRDLSDKILTTDDAGLKGDGTDTTESLQNFFDVASQYAHLNIKAYGTYNVSTNIIASNISSLIGTDFHINGLRESFTFNGYTKGVLQVLDSPNVEVCGVNLKGVRLSNNNDPVGEHRFDNGDAGIHLVNCHNFYAHHNKVDYVKTWGILGEGCNGGTAVYNKISRTTRQSGINIVVGSTSGVAIVAHNEISECGLYGIELEGRDQSTLVNSRAIVHDNQIYNCGQGIVCVGPNFDTQIHDNTITACEKGIMLVKVNLSDVLKGRLMVRDNNIFRCENGISWSGLKHADITWNNINGEQVPSYLIKASNATVDKIISQNSFRTARNLQINDSIYFPVDGSSYVVTAKESIADTEDSGSNAFIITVSPNLSTAITRGDQFKESAMAKRGLDAFYQSYEDCDIQGNHVKSYPIGFYNLPAMDGSQAHSFVLGNTFVDCNSPFYLASNPIGVSIAKNTRIDCGTSTVLQPMLDSGFYEIDYISVMNGLSRSSNPQPFPTVTQYFNNKVYVSKIRLDIPDAKIDSGSQVIVLKINGVDFAQISFSSTSETTISQEMQIISSSVVVDSGKNSFQLVDTSGTLKYANWMVTLIQI
ncbi:MAG: right-handed parallel beta-helix repeat-containing protein [Acinetobacter sp.]|nr:right-handed parallel beta-helix repeat-containing protein [Acinetobacter sp.]